MLLLLVLVPKTPWGNGLGIKCHCDFLLGAPVGTRRRCWRRSDTGVHGDATSDKEI